VLIMPLLLSPSYGTLYFYTFTWNSPLENLEIQVSKHRSRKIRGGRAALRCALPYFDHWTMHRLDIDRLNSVSLLHSMHHAHTTYHLHSFTNDSPVLHYPSFSPSSPLRHCCCSSLVFMYETETGKSKVQICL